MSAGPRLEALLERLDGLRERLEREGAEPDRALELLAEVNALARELAEEIEGARRAAQEEDA
jgi:exonuclease VII small subunit